MASADRGTFYTSLWRFKCISQFDPLVDYFHFTSEVFFTFSL